MLILIDNRYKKILSDSFTDYLLELAALNYLLEEKLIDKEMYESLNVLFINSHISKKI